MMNSDSAHVRQMEKKFMGFRWFLLLLVGPMTFQLSEYRGNAYYLLGAIGLYIIFNIMVSLAIYVDHPRFLVLLKVTVYLDILFISVILWTRGGLRSDLYVVYFLVISYGGIKSGIRGTVASLIQTLIMFTVVVFAFTPPEFFSLNRYLIRCMYLIIFAFVMYQINQILQESFAKEKVAKEMAYRDPLTHLPNRLALAESFERLIENYRQSQEPFAIAIIDIDNFKNINDSKGHAQGDETLVGIAEILQDNTTPEDFIFRFGGEEFVMLFADAGEALMKLDRIRGAIASYDFPIGKITVSVGMSLYCDNYSMIENISFADEAMYAAKNRGKNRVVTYQDMAVAIPV
jgi:diguanylate cyclase (GGDEF)-like protein